MFENMKKLMGPYFFGELYNIEIIFSHIIRLVIHRLPSYVWLRSPTFVHGIAAALLQLTENLAVWMSGLGKYPG